jgi:hypothetical protein
MRRKSVCKGGMERKKRERETEREREKILAAWCLFIYFIFFSTRIVQGTKDIRSYYGDRRYFLFSFLSFLLIFLQSLFIFLLSLLIFLLSLLLFPVIPAIPPSIPPIISCYPSYYFLLPPIISCYPSYYFLLSLLLFPAIPPIISCYPSYYFLPTLTLHSHYQTHDNRKKFWANKEERRQQKWQNFYEQNLAMHQKSIHVKTKRWRNGEREREENRSGDYFMHYIIYSSIIYSSIIYSSIIYSTIIYSSILYSSIIYSTFIYSTNLYSTFIYSTFIYSTIIYFYYTIVFNELFYCRWLGNGRL